MLLQGQLLCCHLALCSLQLMLVPCVLLALDHLITTRMVLGLTIQSTHPPFLLNLGKSHLPWCYVHEYCTYARGAVTHCDGTFLGEAGNIVFVRQTNLFDIS